MKARPSTSGCRRQSSCRVFSTALENKGWIKRHQDPQASRFWQLIEGDGAAMFGVFSPYEKQLLHDWIAGDWTPERPAASVSPQPQ